MLTEIIKLSVIKITSSDLFKRLVAGREYHCHSDCHRHAGDNPALTKGVLARHGWDRSFREPHFNGS